MATLSSRLFAKDSRADVDEEQLLKLFWNRAELKKEFEALEREFAEVEEQSRQKDALVLRVQHRLVQLETLLSDPASAPSLVTHYQLRGVWNRCHQVLESLATDLHRTYRDRAYQAYLEHQQREQESSLAGLEQECAQIGAECDRIAMLIHSLRDQLHTHAGLFGALKRRRLTKEINLLRAQRRDQNVRLNQVVEERRKRTTTSRDDFDGPDLVSRRRINLLIIAYAQELYLFFHDRDIARLAREAAISQSNDIRYGSHRDCRAIQQEVAQRLNALDEDEGIKRRVDARSRLLRTQIDYRNDADAVPMAGSLGTLPLLDSSGKKCGEIGVNVLADEYWDLFAVLLD
jgi:hypothetical protein